MTILSGLRTRCSTLRKSADVGNIRVEYTPFNWLKVDYTLGGDWSADQRFAVFPKSTTDFPKAVVRNDFVNFEVDHNLVITADYEVGQDIVGAIAVGQNLNQREYSRYQVNGSNLISEPISWTYRRPGSRRYRETIRTDGYFVTIADLYDQFYLTAGPLRGSNTFGEERHALRLSKVQRSLGPHRHIGRRHGGQVQLRQGQGGLWRGW